jgi:hypothetical protein
MIAYLRAVHADHIRLGFRSGNCAQCRGEPISWHALARDGRLPPSIVGGVPFDSPGSSVAGLPPDGRRAAQAAESLPLVRED